MYDVRERQEGGEGRGVLAFMDCRAIIQAIYVCIMVGEREREGEDILADIPQGVQGVEDSFYCIINDYLMPLLHFISNNELLGSVSSANCFCRSICSANSFLSFLEASSSMRFSGTSNLG